LTEGGGGSALRGNGGAAGGGAEGPSGAVAQPPVMRTMPIAHNMPRTRNRCAIGGGGCAALANVKTGSARLAE
jgi:hypothetical protein